MSESSRSERRPPVRPRGLRREASIVLPVTLLLFAALACVTLFAYRAAISRLVDERRDWALRQATALAERAARATGTDARPRSVDFERLRDGVPAGAGLAIFDPRGALVWRVEGTGGELEQVPRPASLTGTAVEGPGGASAASIVGWAPFALPEESPGRPAERWLLRFESPEPTLTAELRSLSILTPVVLLLSAAVAALAIAFLYALNRPIAALLERARELPAAGGGEVGSPARREDETDLLLAAFDRALAALRASDTDPSGVARRDAEARLAESVAELGELSAGVAHELRNSLGTIKGYLGLLARRELSTAAREEVEEATRETDALGRVVDDFLAFARPDDRRLGAVETLDFTALVERALGDPSLDLPAGVSFHREYSPAPLYVRGNERLLLRALRNLLLNAVEASRSGAARPIEVTIREDREEGRARLTIRDHGPGIDPAIAARLFAPFASGRSDGAGLGLALARRIVLLHTGHLTLTSHPGGGAVAELQLSLGDSVTNRSRSL